MIRLSCYESDSCVTLDDFDAIEVENGIFHKKWKGFCMSSDLNEYIDFTRVYMRGEHEAEFNEIE